ncbi:bacteriocin [candidate division FCPU426 bacterium]|nr:bacteriocin [candidate division FCPU426 bacterium]
MDLKLNLKQLTDDQLKQVSGGVRVAEIKICRCRYDQPPGSEFRGDTNKYVLSPLG